MSRLAKISTNGRSQSVYLPADIRFNTKAVFIHRDPETGDVILSRKPENWDGFLAALKGGDIPKDFLNETERNQANTSRDPFEGWKE